MIQYGFLSRNLENKDTYEEVYHKRIQAKKEGDLRTSNALKLSLNTAYGILLNQYNDMFDPKMGRSVCITGQLLLTDLIMQYIKKCETVKIISVNTDGVMLSIDDSELPVVYAINGEWEARTRIGLEEDKIQKVVMRDVNNYVMREVSGGIKVKGGVVSDYKGGDFKHNSLSIVCKAIVDNLLDNVEIDKTINDCNDIFAFQMVVKAGGSYDKVVHSTGIGDVEVNRTNRLFASKDQRVGAVYKIKSDGRRDKVANCPLHAIVDNSGTISIDKIDKKWYIELAQKRAREFRGDKSMGSEEELEVIIDDDDSKLVKPIIKTVAKEKKAGGKVEVTPFKVKLFNLARDIGESAKSLVKDGYNLSQSYEYVKASQYKTMLRIAVARNELIMKIDDMVCQPTDVLKSEKMTLTQYHGVLTLIDTTSEEKMTYMIWSQGADNLDKGLSKAKTLAIKDFVKSNFLVSDAEDDPEADTASKSASAKKFVTPTESDKKVKEVMKDSTMANVESVEKLKDIITRIREKSGDATYGDKVMGELLSGPITSARETVLLTKLEIKGGEYGLEI